MSQPTDPQAPSEPNSVQRMRALLDSSIGPELDALAEFLANSDDRQLLGHAQFALRDLVHSLGAKALQAALPERKKRATKVPA